MNEIQMLLTYDPLRKQFGVQVSGDPDKVLQLGMLAFAQAQVLAGPQPQRPVLAIPQPLVPDVVR